MNSNSVKNNLRRFTIISAGYLFFFILFSYATRGQFGSSICQATPLCLPNTWVDVAFLLHRALSALFLLWLVFVLFFIWRHYRTNHLLLNLATLSVILYFFQLLLGMLFIFGYQVTTSQPNYHQATSGLVLLDAILLAIVSWHTSDPEQEHPELDLRERFFDVVMLTKPVIVLLLLFTTLSGMFFAAKAVPTPSLIIMTMIGGALAAGGSGAINQYLDRDLDSEMQRTAKRPLPSGRIYPSEALAIGIAFCVISLLIFLLFVNLVSAALTLLGMIYYVYFYSVLLKKATVQNIVIGGGAGALPSVIGWTAVTGSVALPAVLLFLIVFMWTPPHFWALAIVRQKDYSKVNIPMLPVIRGEAETRKSILIYSVVLVAVTMLLPLFGFTGLIYLVSAGVLGLGFLFLAYRVYTVQGNKVSWTLYKYSSYYLLFIFLAVMADAIW